MISLLSLNDYNIDQNLSWKIRNATKYYPTKCLILHYQ